MSQLEIMETVLSSTFLYVIFYTFAVIIAWFYDNSKNVSVGVFALVLAVTMTLTYIINIALILGTETGANVAGITGIIIGITTFQTVAYLVFRNWQEKKCPTITSSSIGGLVTVK